MLNGMGSTITGLSQSTITLKSQTFFPNAFARAIFMIGITTAVTIVPIICFVSIFSAT
jgi:hypothetical protein